MKRTTIVTRVGSLAMVMVIAVSCLNPTGSGDADGDAPGEGDAGAFAFESSGPADGATDVAVWDWITITFTANVDPVSVTGESVLFTAAGGEWDVDVSVDGAAIVIEPNTPYPRDSALAVTVTTAVTDTDGNPLPSQLDLSFHTVAVPANSTDYGYEGSDAVAMRGTVNVSAMTTEMLAAADYISIGISRCDSDGCSGGSFPFYLGNYPVGATEIPFEIVNIDPNGTHSFTVSVQTISDPIHSTYVVGQSATTTQPGTANWEAVDFSAGDVDVGTIEVWDANDQRAIGGGTVSGVVDLSGVADLSQYTTVKFYLTHDADGLLGGPEAGTQLFYGSWIGTGTQAPFEFVGVDPTGSDPDYELHCVLVGSPGSRIDAMVVSTLVEFTGTPVTDLWYAANTDTPVVSSPAHGVALTNVAVDAPIAITFSETLQVVPGYCGLSCHVRRDGTDWVATGRTYVYASNSPGTNPVTETIYYDAVEILASGGSWEYDTSYTVQLAGCDLAKNYVDPNPTIFTFTTEPTPVQTTSGAALASGTYQDPTASIVYAFATDGSVTRTMGGQDATGTWEYNGDDFIIVSLYHVNGGSSQSGGSTITFTETHNAGYTLDEGASLFLQGWERTSGSGTTIVGTWEFSSRTDVTTQLYEGTSPNTSTEVTGSITFSEDGTWSSTVTTSSTGADDQVATDSGTWDADDLAAGSYMIVDFNGREFLYAGDEGAYTRQ